MLTSELTSAIAERIKTIPDVAHVEVVDDHSVGVQLSDGHRYLVDVEDVDG